GSGTSGAPGMQTAIVADPRSNSVLLRAATAAQLEVARDLIEHIDSPETQSGNLHVVYLRNARASRLAEVLRGVLSGQDGDAASSDDALGLSSATGAGLAGNGASGINTGTSTPMGGGTGGGTLGDAIDGMGLNLGGSRNPSQSVALTAGGATIHPDAATNKLINAAPLPRSRSPRE